MTTVLDSLNAALHQAMTDDEHVILLGEDILDPYGGAFKVTRGLSTEFPGRVLTTPVSEAAITGVAGGMALRGLRPVVEIMFGDFTTLITDQVVNHLSKFRGMYNNQVRVPIVIRTPMGGRRGYGPTHSQTLEKLFLGIPGLRVLAPCALDDPGRLLRDAILLDDDPVLFIENKLLYYLPIQDEKNLAEFNLTPISHTAFEDQALEAYDGYRVLDDHDYAPTLRLRLRGAPNPQITLVAYGYMSEICRQAALRLAYEKEIFVEIIVPTQLAPVQIAPIVESVKQTGRLLTVEEGSLTLGWGAELLAQAAQRLGNRLQIAQRLGGAELPIPASTSLEAAVLPGVDDVMQAAEMMV